MNDTKTLLAILGAVVEMSDKAEALGGAKSIAGVAALHTLQTSIQKNRPRLIEIAHKIEAASKVEAIVEGMKP